MATIDYTRRSVKLKNLGEVRSVDVAREGEAALGAASQNLGRSLAGFGREIGHGAEKLAVDLDFLERRERERQVAKAANEIMYRNDQGLLSDEKDPEGLPIGILHWTGERVRNIQKYAAGQFENHFAEVTGEMQLDEKATELLRLKLDAYARGCENRVMLHQSQEYRRMEIGDAKALWQRDLKVIEGGNNTPQMFDDALNDFTHYLDVTGVTGEERKNELDTFKRTVVASYLGTKLAGVTTVEGAEAEVKALKENPEYALEGTGAIGESLKGKLGANTSRELVRMAERHRNDLFAQQEHDRRIAVAELKDRFARQELELADEDATDERWIGFYEDLSGDEDLRKLSPETALKYSETAKKIRAAVEKGVSDQTEDSLSLRLTDLERRELEGDAALQGPALAAAQADIWRDFKVALAAGRLNDNFATSFLHRLKNRLSDEERQAMRLFYSSIGYYGELDSHGEVTSRDRKDLAKEAYFLPMDETQVPTGDLRRGRKLSGLQAFALGDTFLRELKTMGPEAYRPEVMRTVIANVKTRHLAGEFNRDRDLMAREFLNIERNLKAELETREENDGKRDDDGNDDGDDAGDDESGDEED